jgi:hypothetical protein
MPNGRKFARKSTFLQFFIEKISKNYNIVPRTLLPSLEQFDALLFHMRDLNPDTLQGTSG